MKNKRLTLVLLFGILLGVISLGITLYPLIGNYLSDKNKSTVLTEYARTVDQLEDTSIREMLADAQAYNNALMPGTLSMENIFSQAGHAVAEERYYDLLAVNSDGIMGYVDIPKIAVYLPIYHGTDSDVLNMGIGHLIGSSLPIGGESTHTVLTGHSGMAREKMFSDLDQLKEGDVFYLHVLNQALAYEVDQIKIVLPDNTDYLGIEKGQDYCTLITCFPFGVNTHRLLVRGHRVEYVEPESTNEAKSDFENNAEPVASTWEQQYIKGLMIAFVIMIVGIILSRTTIFRRRRGKHEARPSYRTAKTRR